MATSLLERWLAARRDRLSATGAPECGDRKRLLALVDAYNARQDPMFRITSVEGTAASRGVGVGGGPVIRGAVKVKCQFPGLSYKYIPVTSVDRCSEIIVALLQKARPPPRRSWARRAA